MKLHRLFKPVTIAALASLLMVCSSVPDEIEEGLTPMEYFQRAQEASDAGRYALSMAYYEKFQEQYPEDQYPEERDRNIWAEYEIAFLYHKMGKNQIALDLFEALLERYESGEPDLPEGPRILAEKVKLRIEEALASEQTEKETSGE
jgi:tetratricopeptide (TPR) repeat protein